MSADDGGGAGGREVAYRVFAAEYEDADFSYSESDEDRAPNYVVLPTGARVNRVFVVGVLTEVEDASEDILRARVVDPTGAFVVYAGQYQPEATAFLDRADPPTFVAVTGKARTFQPDDSDVTYTSIRPENINAVDAETRDRWTVQCAEQTIDRVGTMARALTHDERGDELRRRLESKGVDVGLAAGVPLAIDHYGTTATYLDAVDTLATQATEVVADERDEVDQLRTDPDDGGSIAAASLAAESAAGTASAVATETTAETDATATETTEAADSEVSSDAEPATAADASGETETDTEADAAAETEADSASASAVETAPGGTASTDSDSGETVTETASTDTAESESVDDTAEPESATSFDETDTSGGDVGGDELEDFEPAEFELDEDEREEIEEEYGTDFQTGTEVDDPGKADIDSPTPEEEVAEPDTSVETGTGDGDAVTTEETAVEQTPSTEETADEGTATDEGISDEGTTDESSDEETPDEGAAETPPPETEDVDLDDAVMEAMRDHDEGDGASEDAIVGAVTDTYGVAADDVREAIQDALMDGRCYEPEDDVYKPI